MRTRRQTTYFRQSFSQASPLINVRDVFPTEKTLYGLLVLEMLSNLQSTKIRMMYTNILQRLPQKLQYNIFSEYEYSNVIVNLRFQVDQFIKLRFQVDHCS